MLIHTGIWPWPAALAVERRWRWSYANRAKEGLGRSDKVREGSSSNTRGKREGAHRFFVALGRFDVAVDAERHGETRGRGAFFSHRLERARGTPLADAISIQGWGGGVPERRAVFRLRTWMAASGDPSFV